MSPQTDPKDGPTYAPTSPSPPSPPGTKEPHRDEPGNIRLLTLKSGGWVLLLALLLSLAAAVWLAYLAASSQREVVGDGQNPETFGFDLENLLIPADMLTAFEQPRDYRPVLDEPGHLPALTDPRQEPRFDIDATNRGMRGKYVVPDDRVIAVEIDGKARAYPLRILAAHEIVNDTLAGVPIAVTYSPIADTVAVYDRRIPALDPGGESTSEEPVRFGLSGLIVNQNLVMYDRQPGGPFSGEESLWLQISGKAIAGPRAGVALRRLPAQLVRYGDFVDRFRETIAWDDEETGEVRHADVTPRASVMIVEGIARWVRGDDFAPVLDKKYRHFLETYRRDDQTDTLSHPVAPLPELREGERLKDRVIVVFAPGEAELVVAHEEVMATPGRRLTKEFGGGEVSVHFQAVRTVHHVTVAVGVDPPEAAAELGILHTFRYAWHAAKHLETSASQ